MKYSSRVKTIFVAAPKIIMGFLPKLSLSFSKIPQRAKPNKNREPKSPISKLEYQYRFMSVIQL